MASRMRIGLMGVAVTLLAFTGFVGARQQPTEQTSAIKPNFDVRTNRAPAPGSARAQAELDSRNRLRTSQRRDVTRLHPHTGALRVLDAPGWSVAQNAATGELAALLRQSADRLGLEDDDLDSIAPVRDYVSQSTGLRHVTFAQSFDGLPVFGGLIAIHVASDGTVVRVTSSAARGSDRTPAAAVSADAAAAAAANDILPGSGFRPVRVGSGEGNARARFARGAFKRDVTASLEWFAIDGGARLAWHVELEPDGVPQFYDVMIDAGSGELLLRRNRVLDAEGSGRVMQSDATQAADPRQPDWMPAGADACPPPINHELRDLTQPFRDSGTVLFNSGRLSGNNVHVFRGNSGNEGALGTFDGSRWTFDYPFNTAASAETALFFAINFAHDFFYDLGFDEAAGNFQVDNFGRGGTGGDPLIGLARAPGRNNATFQPMPEGTSPIVSMFLFDGIGCWGQDVDGDGSLDLDGDFDNDVVMHEFHHGVDHRLNTEFTGAEADAMGEGGSDFFAYTVSGNSVLGEYSWPGGIRQVNAKTYADWICFFFIFCEPHANGEIWVNVLWDIRERFRTDLVGGSEAAAINEVSQLVIDATKLSPPAPTMLDMRDAMLLADSVRNPGTPNSQNFCRLWESFAARGMGLNATDTADNGLNQVAADFSGPTGCNTPPAPVVVTVSASTQNANEAGPVNGAFTVRRGQATTDALTVNVTITGTATAGSDYQTLTTVVTIPANAMTAVVPVVPINDTTVEVNETVVMTVAPGGGYLPGTPASATVTIVSDDTPPDLTISSLSAPADSGAGLAISVNETTRNQGTVGAPASTTSYYLSVNSSLDAADTLLDSRPVPALAAGATDPVTTSLTIPEDTVAGVYRIIAKADGPSQLVETNELNNTRAVSVRIGPDLTVSSLTVPANIAPAVPFTTSYTITNTGGSRSAESTTRFYLSDDLKLDAADDQLQSQLTGEIDPDQALPGTISLTVPANKVGGVYYVIAVADGNQQVAEASETNNTRFASTRVGPDLRIATLTVPTKASIGSTIAVTDQTKNFGPAGAGSSRTAFYLSTNGLLDANDTPLNVWRQVGPLGANEFSQVTTNITLPAIATAGVWYIIANADDANEVAEGHETNNTRAAAVNVGPDLGVSTSTVPSTFTAGTTITVNETVKNSGLDPAGASTTRFYLSLNASLDGSDTPLAAERAVPPLAPNATSAGPTSLPIPAGFSGRYYLIMVADGDNAVTESSETNNTRVVSVTINP